MRKQYHFWPDESGHKAWDVDRLVELSAYLPVHEIDPSTLREVDTAYWFDSESDPPTVRRVIEHARLMEEVDVPCPIILGSDGRIMDGMHRVARAILDGRQTIPAVRFEVDPEPDYRNVRHPDDLPYD